MIKFILPLVYDVCTLSSMKKYNLYLSDQQLEALETLSTAKGISVSELVRRALDLFIEQQEKKVNRMSPFAKRRNQTNG